MQMSFEELKTLYRLLYVDVDDLVSERLNVNDEKMAKSEIAYARLELAAKLAYELLKFKPIPSLVLSVLWSIIII